MKLLLADDHTLFREALAQFIERAEPGANVALAGDIRGVMDLLAEGYVPDLVLLDLRMPGMDGLRGMEAVRRDYPDLPVALVSGLAERVQVERAMALGAAGFFPKTLPGSAMLGGIREILAGVRFLPVDRNTGRIMPSYYDGVRRAQAVIDTKEARLTPREKEVLGYLARGASNGEIADALGVQIVTIKLHVRGICRKLGARNRTQAALKAQQMGMV